MNLCASVMIGIVTLAVASDTEPVRIDAIEQWRTIDDESVPYLFGVIRTVDVDSRGRVYVLDRQLQEIHRFSATGAYDRRIVGPGQGPGELSMTFRFAIGAGDRIVIPHSVPPSLSFVDDDGEYVDSVTFEDDAGESTFSMLIGPFTVHDTGIVAEGEILDFSVSRGYRTRLLASFDSEGRLLAELARVSRPRYDFDAKRIVVNEIESFFPGARHAVAPDGRIYIAEDRELYRITVYQSDGSVSGVIERNVPARQRTPAEVEEAKKGYAFSRSDGGRIPEVDFTMARTEPPISKLMILGGELWVGLDTPGLPETCLGRFSVHTLYGDYVGTREIYVPHDPKHDATQILRDGRIAVLQNVRDASRAMSARSSVRRGEEMVEVGESESGAKGVILIIYATARD